VKKRERKAKDVLDLLEADLRDWADRMLDFEKKRSSDIQSSVNHYILVQSIERRYAVEKVLSKIEALRDGGP
jgi:hypothetical protein